MTQTHDINEPLREAILEQALTLAQFDGWTESMLDNACKNAGYDDTMTWRRVFGNAPIDVINYFTRKADESMVAELANANLSDMRIRDRIAHIVMTRLHQHTPHKEAVRRAIAHMMLPQHAAHSTKAIAQTMDDMWHAAGDTSTDFNFYTKRATLAKVYSATLFVWLNDESDTLEETEAFLRRRIENVMQFEKFKSKLKDIKEKCQFGTRH